MVTTGVRQREYFRDGKALLIYKWGGTEPEETPQSGDEILGGCLYVDFLLPHRSEIFLPMFWTASI